MKFVAFATMLIFLMRSTCKFWNNFCVCATEMIAVNIFTTGLVVALAGRVLGWW